MPWMLEDISFYSVTKWEIRFLMHCIAYIHKMEKFHIFGNFLNQETEQSRCSLEHLLS
jgi:hypothetical protein